METINKIKEIVATLEPALEAEQADEGRAAAEKPEDEVIKGWLRLFFAVPGRVLEESEKALLADVIRASLESLEHQENQEKEVRAEDMDDLFESEEAQKQKFKAILAAKCNKFTNEIWNLKKKIQEQIESITESLKNQELSFEQLKTVSAKTKGTFSNPPSNLEKSLESSESALKALQASKREYNNWSTAFEQYPDNFVELLDNFLLSEVTKVQKIQAFQYSVDWTYYGEESSWLSSDSRWLWNLRDEIEISYYLFDGYPYYLKVLYLTRQSLGKPGPMKMKRNESDEFTTIEPTIIKIARSKIHKVGFIKPQYEGLSSGFSLILYDKSNTQLEIIGSQNGNPSLVEMKKGFFVGIQTKQNKNGRVTSLAVGFGKKSS